MMIFQVILTILLVFLNGFFVAAEFAIVKVRSSQLELKSHVNRQLTATAKHIVSHLDAYLAATQLGITIASLGLGWIGEEVVAKIMLRLFSAFGLTLSEATAHNISLPLAFFMITILHIVFGELAPKSLAIRYPTKITFAVAFPLRAFYFVFRPFIWLLNGFANILLRMVGVRPVHGAEIHSEEELRIIIQESAAGGEIEPIEQTIVERVFALGDRKVRELMTHRTDLAWFHIDDSLSTVRQKAGKERHSVYPVARGTLDELAGVVSVKDIFPLEIAEEEFRLAHFIQKPLIVHELVPAYKVLEQFKHHRLHYAIAVNEYGAVQGMIAMDDILDALVGDATEYNQEEYQLVKRDDGSWLVDGQYSFFEFLEYFGLQGYENQHDNFNTIGGLILHLLSHIPATGEKISWKGFQFEIIDMDGQRIDKILITRISDRGSQQVK